MPHASRVKTMKKEPGDERFRRMLLELIRSGEFMKIIEEEALGLLSPEK
jgi:hypothetical protein